MLEHYYTISWLAKCVVIENYTQEALTPLFMSLFIAQGKKEKIKSSCNEK